MLRDWQVPWQVPWHISFNHYVIILQTKYFLNFGFTSYTLFLTSLRWCACQIHVIVNNSLNEYMFYRRGSCMFGPMQKSNINYSVFRNPSVSSIFELYYICIGLCFSCYIRTIIICTIPKHRIIQNGTNVNAFHLKTSQCANVQAIITNVSSLIIKPMLADA